jgi:HK97 family phage portal protein
MPLVAWLDLFRGGRKSASTLDIIREIYGRIWETKAGRTVNLDTAIQVSAVFACCRLIGNGMAQVPLKLMRESIDAKGRTRREPAKDHPLYDLMARRPNPWQTSFGFRQTWSWHLELSGNFIAFKNVLLGTTRELIPLDPTKVKVTQRDDMSLKYELTGKNGETREIPAEAIFHVRGPSWDGWKGLEVLRAAKEAVGLAIVTEESQASLHKNGVRNSGVYSVEGKLSAEQYEALRKWIEREAAGAAKAGMPMILDRSAKWLQTQMSGVDAQHLETRKHQLEEVCAVHGRAADHDRLLTSCRT